MTAPSGDARDAARLSSLTLRFFRSHQKFELKPPIGLIALVGPNGVGKTNVLEAISALAPGRGLRGASSEEMAMRGGGVGWSVSATLAASGRSADLQVVYDQTTGRRTAKIDGEPGPQTAMADLLRLVWLTPAMDRLWIEGASGRRKYLDRLTLAFDARHGERSAAYERAMRERNRLLKEGRADPSWLDALEARLAESGLAIVAARGATLSALADADARPDRPPEEAFPSADLALEGPAEDGAPETEADYAARLRADRPGDAAAGRTRFGPHRSDLSAIYRAKGAPAAQCSTGEQKALLLSLTLTAAAALRVAHGAAPILLLDEVAAHLDPDRRAALFDALFGLGAQVWTTGAQATDFEAVEARATVVRMTDAEAVIPR